VITEETVVLIAKRAYRTVWLTEGTGVVVSGGCGTNAGAQLPSQNLIARSPPSLWPFLHDEDQHRKPQLGLHASQEKVIGP
jgi:hypothetical protein